LRIEIGVFVYEKRKNILYLLGSNAVSGGDMLIYTGYDGQRRKHDKALPYSYGGIMFFGCACLCDVQFSFFDIT